MPTAAEREKNRAKSQKRRDDRNEVGALPAVKDPEKREKVLGSLLEFLLLFEDIFLDPFGEVQLSSIAHEENILVTRSGNINKLEPRGYGKSTRSILAAVWACLKGVQDFVMVCCDSKEKAGDLLKMAHMALGEKDYLLDLFPELQCFHHLEGNPHKCTYQRFEGTPTQISIKGDTIVFPTLGKGFASEGAMIVARPFKKARGKNVKTKRPSAVVLDDVQSTEDSNSPTAVNKLVKVLSTDIAFLGTRKNPVAIVNNATVIRDGDYPSRVAAMQAFTTIRYKMVKSFPKNDKLWEVYQTIRQDYDPSVVGARDEAAGKATKFYRDNFEAMNEGSEVTWDYAYSPAKQQISTIQAAMDFIADYGRAAFDSECQNEPSEDKPSMELLAIRDIMAKQTKCKAGVPLTEHNTVVAFIDIHEKILDFEVWSYDDYFGGSKILGGTWPDQKTLSFNHSKPPRPLGVLKEYRGMTDATRICEALEDLLDFLCDREWIREDGSPMRLRRVGVDVNGFYSDDLKKALRQSKWASLIAPTFGMGITARKIAISRLPHNKNKKSIGPEWAPKKKSPGEIQCYIFDANHWKTRFHKQLALPKSARGSLLMHKAPPEVHRRSAEGYRAETPTEETAYGRTIHEWSLLPGHENHPLDCAVGCMVMASMCGVRTADTGSKAEKRTVSLAKLQRRKR